MRMKMKRFVGLYLVVFVFIVVAIAFVRQGQDPNVGPAYTEGATSVHEDRYEDAVQRGHAKMESGQFRAAIFEYNDAIAQNPSDGGLYMARGLARAQLDDFSGALADFTQAVTLQPDSSQAYFGRAAMKHNLGQEEGAAADCDIALELAQADGDDELVAGIRNLCGLAPDE